MNNLTTFFCLAATPEHHDPELYRLPAPQPSVRRKSDQGILDAPGIERPSSLAITSRPRPNRNKKSNSKQQQPITPESKSSLDSPLGLASLQPRTGSLGSTSGDSSYGASLGSNTPTNLNTVSSQHIVSSSSGYNQGTVVSYNTSSTIHMQPHATMGHSQSFHTASSYGYQNTNPMSQNYYYPPSGTNPHQGYYTGPAYSSGQQPPLQAINQSPVASKRTLSSNSSTGSLHSYNSSPGRKMFQSGANACDPTYYQRTPNYYANTSSRQVTRKTSTGSDKNYDGIRKTSSAGQEQRGTKSFHHQTSLLDRNMGEEQDNHFPLMQYKPKSEGSKSEKEFYRQFE